MTEWSPCGFYEWYKELMNQCYEYRIWILLYHMFDPKCTEPRGFVCSDIYAGHLPSAYECKLKYCESTSTMACSDPVMYDVTHQLAD